MIGALGQGSRPVVAARLALMGVLVFAFVWKAATPPIPALLTALGFGLIGIAAAFRRPADRRAARWFDTAMGLAGALALLGLAQALRLGHHPLANPAWEEAAALLGPLPGAISVAPFDTLQALPAVIAPFLAFVGTLAFFDEDRSATALIRCLALLGGAFALFGLVQITLLPGSLFLFEKAYYIDSLTGFWVNRNVAGALLGVASFAALVWLLDVVKGIDRPRRVALLLREGDTGLSSGQLLPAALLALCLLALFLTKSRGALVATGAAYGVVLPLLMQDAAGRLWRGGGAGVGRRIVWLRIAAVVAGLLSVGLVVLLFGGLASARLMQEGVDEGRLCFYRAAWAAFRAQPWLGWGLGTFDSVFPLFREPDCGALSMSVSRAHNAYLQGLVELGLPFALFVVALVGSLLALIRSGTRNRIRRRHVPIAGLGVVILLACHGLVDFSPQIPGMAIYTAVFLGAVATIGLRRRRAAPHRPRPVDQDGAWADA
ncbi:O-antigen ligase family protein [Aureimonas sp. N4]|uniref:O-antigen ligase family protein n=1 Tax=Aureimonas sp. N4 TaxID=1638165 RepID=UPI0007867F90|nr:O-antigen ligase family protein [Aureimonas sp. N4]